MKRLISFFEIPTTDFKRAVKFYENVLCIQFSIFECEDEKMAFFPEEEGNAPGAISYGKDFFPSKDGVLIHFHVNDMEDTVLRIKQNGGKIVREKTKIEADGMGYFSLFIDSEGNRLGLYSDK